MSTREKEKLITPTQFAKKYKLSRATVWRWMTDRKHTIRFKMYDAEPVVIAGKNFIRIK